MDAPPAATRVTGRSIAKASRRAALLNAAAQLFAERGYKGVSIEDLGAAAGVSGPAVYRHFSGKPAVLAALLAGVSEDLLEGSNAVVEDSPTPEHALKGLIEFQVDFALRNANVIRVQDRDLSSLSIEDEETVRSLQRRYVEVWVDTMALRTSEVERDQLRRKAHAAFGLINSTPHSTHRRKSSRDTAELRTLLEQMAWAAINA